MTLLINGLFAAMFLGGVTVTLQPEAHVRGAEIELAAVAKVEGANADEVALVRKLSLGWAPAPGYSRFIVDTTLAADVARLAPTVSVTVCGANACRVWPLSEHVAGAAIEAAARAELAKLLEGRDAQMHLAAVIGDIEIPSGERAHELRAVVDSSDLRGGPLNVPVRVMIDGGLYRTIWTNWDVELWEQCAVPKLTIHAGEPIQAEMLETKRVAQRGRIGASLPASMIAGTSAAHDLPAGQPVVEQQLVRPTLIARGDTLFLEIRRGPVSARIGVTAQQAGKLGERIRVNVIEGARELTATVASRDLVVIDMNSTGTPR